MKIHYNICFFVFFLYSLQYNLFLGGSLRSRGWKYGSGFVDGIFPVLSPVAQQILNFVQKEMDIDRMWSCLDTLPFTNNTWDDLINVAVQLRLNKQWDAIIKVSSHIPLFFLSFLHGWIFIWSILFSFLC